jgi:hypothetical protein
MTERITAERLRGLLAYDPVTGIFTWAARSSPYSCVCIGGVAGAIYSDGYRRIKIDGRAYNASRLAVLWVTGAWPRRQIDHINHDRADNRFCNLREASQSQNSRNMSTRKDTVSGFKGVRWLKANRKWASRIIIDGKHKHLGCFDSAESAFIAYMAAAFKHFNGFANIDCPLFVQYRKLKARKALEHNILCDLASPDYMQAAI